MDETNIETMRDGVYFQHKDGLINMTIVGENEYAVASAGIAVAKQILLHLYQKIVEAELYSTGESEPIDLMAGLASLQAQKVDRVSKDLLKDFDDDDEGWYENSPFEE